MACIDIFYLKHNLHPTLYVKYMLLFTYPLSTSRLITEKCLTCKTSFSSSLNTRWLVGTYRNIQETNILILSWKENTPMFLLIGLNLRSFFSEKTFKILHKKPATYVSVNAGQFTKSGDQV